MTTQLRHLHAVPSPVPLKEALRRTLAHYARTEALEPLLALARQLAAAVVPLSGEETPVWSAAYARVLPGGGPMRCGRDWAWVYLDATDPLVLGVLLSRTDDSPSALHFRLAWDVDVRDWRLQGAGA